MISPLKRGREIFGNFTPKLADDCKLRFKLEFDVPSPLLCGSLLLGEPSRTGVEVTGAVDGCLFAIRDRVALYLP